MNARLVIAVLAMIVFLATGALIVWAPAEQPVRFAITVLLVFGIAALASALAVASVGRPGRG